MNISIGRKKFFNEVFDSVKQGEVRKAKDKLYYEKETHNKLKLVERDLDYIWEKMMDSRFRKFDIENLKEEKVYIKSMVITVYSNGKVERFSSISDFIRKTNHSRHEAKQLLNDKKRSKNMILYNLKEYEKMENKKYETKRN